MPRSDDDGTAIWGARIESGACTDSVGLGSGAAMGAIGIFGTTGSTSDGIVGRVGVASGTEGRSVEPVLPGRSKNDPEGLDEGGK